MLWVHATLVETSLAAFGRFVGQLPPAEEEVYYREMALVARVFGLPSSAIPATLADFREYVRTRVAGPEICVTAPAREVAAVILEAPLPAPLRVLVPAHRLATAALLPARLARSTALAGAMPTGCRSRLPRARCVSWPCHSCTRLGASRRLRSRMRPESTGAQTWLSCA